MADKIEILPLSNSAANQIKYEITRPEKLEKYFEGDEFIAEYGFGLENIPEEILSIPALTAVTPLAWATDTEIHIDTVEEGFLESLKETRFKYNEHYPDVFGNGCCIKPNSTKKIPHDKESVIVNFSGGVDSTATYLRHRSNPTILTSVDHASYSESESNLRIKYLEKLNNLPHTH